MERVGLEMLVFWRPRDVSETAAFLLAPFRTKAERNWASRAAEQ